MKTYIVISFLKEKREFTRRNGYGYVYGGDFRISGHDNICACGIHFHSTRWMTVSLWPRDYHQSTWSHHSSLHLFAFLFLYSFCFVSDLQLFSIKFFPPKICSWVSHLTIHQHFNTHPIPQCHFSSLLPRENMINIKYGLACTTKIMYYYVYVSSFRSQ